CGLPLPGGPVVGDGRPHAQVELAPELGDQALGVVPDVAIALGEEDVALARGHANQLHASIMPSTSTGPAPEPIPLRPLATASEAIRRAEPGASSAGSPRA